MNQLNNPVDIAIDKESILIADTSNNRVLRWNNGNKEGTIFCENCCPASIAIHNNYIYISDLAKHEVFIRKNEIDGDEIDETKLDDTKLQETELEETKLEDNNLDESKLEENKLDESKLA